MCERTSSSHRRRKGTAAATFVIYEGTKDEIANQVNALLDSGAKIFRTEMVAGSMAMDADYAVSVLFVANYFHPVAEEAQEPDDRPDHPDHPDQYDRETLPPPDDQSDQAEPEKETVTEDLKEEEEKFENADLSKAEDIVEPE